MFTYRYFVEDITCGHCAFTINKGLSRLEGVLKVRVDVRSRRAEVDADESVAEGDLRQAFAELGYPAALVEKVGEGGAEPVRDHWRNEREEGARGGHGEHGGDHVDAGACHVG